AAQLEPQRPGQAELRPLQARRLARGESDGRAHDGRGDGGAGQGDEQEDKQAEQDRDGRGHGGDARPDCAVHRHETRPASGICAETNGEGGGFLRAPRIVCAGLSAWSYKSDSKISPQAMAGLSWPGGTSGVAKRWM